MHIVSSALSDVGRKRERNEDSMVCCDEVSLYVVADGMGGHAAGEVAAKTAMDVIHEFVRRALSNESVEWPEEMDADLKQEHRILVGALHQANRTILSLAQGNEEWAGMGTTVVGLLVRGQTAYVVHVGDSRLYLLRGGRLQLLTTDHSWVNEQLRLNIITPQEARNHRWRNVITRALGNKIQLEVDTLEVEIEPSDLYLLCTDGLTTMVEDAQIEKTLLETGESLDETARRLVDMANEAGGQDNITLILLQAAP